METENNQKGILAYPLLISCFVCVSLLFIFGKPTSYIWVMDSGRLLNETYLVKMCPNGTRLWQVQFGQSEVVGIDGLHGIVWAPELNNTNGVHYDQMVKLDSQGNILDRYQGYGTSTFAVDPNDGSLWIYAHDRIAKILPDGTLLLRKGEFSAVESVAVDPRDGSVWIADGLFHRNLIHLDANGAKLFEMETPGFFSNAPHQVAVNPRNGDVWFTGFHSGDIYHLSTDGQLLAVVGGFDRPASVTVDSRDGSAWVADYSVDSSGGVVQINSNGKVVRRVVLDAPPHVAAYNPFDGTLWVGMDGSMVRLYASGTIVEQVSGFTVPKSIAFAQNDDWISSMKCAFYFYFKPNKP